MCLHNHTLYPQQSTTNFETTEPVEDIDGVDKQVHHTRGWAGKCKKHNYLVCIYTFRGLWSLVGPGGASGAVVQVMQNDTLIIFCVSFSWCLLTQPDRG